MINFDLHRVAEYIIVTRMTTFLKAKLKKSDDKY